MKRAITLLAIPVGINMFHPLQVFAETPGINFGFSPVNAPEAVIAGITIIMALFYLIVRLLRSNKKLKISRDDMENFYALRKTFIDADERLIYLKDENLKYVFVNKALENFYRKSTEEIIGTNDYTLSAKEFADRRKHTDVAVLEKGTLVVDEVEWGGRLFKTTKFPVRMLNGKFGVGAYVTDVTEEYERQKLQEKVLYRLMILTDVLTRGFRSKQEQLDYVLHEALKLTESQFGYIYLYDEDKREFTLSSWTKGVMDECDVVEKQTIYQLDKTGIWGEVVRQRRPIIVNDFTLPNPLKKGYPEGHVEIKRFMSLPVIIDEKILAVVGLANSNNDYDGNDINELTVLMNGVWNAVERREAQEKLSFERNKYLQTLISIGDGVMVVDPNGQVEMLNRVAEKLTGWSIGEARGKHYREIFAISHEQETMTINDPIANVLLTDTIQELGNHAMLTSRDGTRYYLEDSAAPIKNDEQETVGVVLVFRDVTDKKEQRKKIEYLSFHDSLTGLYNRRFFEEELQRLDTERNLPLSIIMGDVNGLKLTNDIFGHTFGDLLLEKVAQVLSRVCRTDDIIARWGGDEFILLLPKTNREEAAKIIYRIKEEFAQEKIKAIKGSISMGTESKEKLEDKLVEVVNRAEENMYSAKTLDRNEVREGLIDTIISMLHENSDREKEHSLRVSKLCQELGSKLELPELDIRKLKTAGYLHDIGKIVVDPKCLKRNFNLSREELSEIRKHTLVGYRILNSFEDTVDLAEVVLAHHENWDGTGYPKGLKGEEIPLLARIIKIVGYYDRMIYDAEDSGIRTKAEAVRVIREKAGTNFDPQLAEAFAHMVE